MSRHAALSPGLAAALVLSLVQAITAEEFPSVEHGRYMARVADEGEFVPVEPTVTAEMGTLQVLVERTGRMQINTCADSFVIESCFSYPGPERKIGWNGLPRGFSQDNYPDVTTQLGPEGSWEPRVRKRSADTITVDAVGKCYRLARTIRLAEGRVDIADALTNLRDSPTAVVPRHRVTASRHFRSRFSVNLEVAANPTVYLKGPRDGLGLVMQDNLSRFRIRPWVPESGNRAGFQVNRIVLAPGSTRTLAWSAYALKPADDYFDFINRVRSDWNANYTIEGPFNFVFLDNLAGDFRLESSSTQFRIAELERDPQPLLDYLNWKHLSMVAVSPFLDYDPGAFDHVLSRDEYAQAVTNFRRTVKRIAPAVRILGSVETDWVSLPVDRMAGAEGLPRTTKGGERSGIVSEELTPEHIRIIEAGLPEWKDSFIRTRDGKLYMELYVRAGKQVAPAIRVFPRVGNHHYDFIVGQVKFLTQDLGLDGVYFDEFALGNIGAQRSFLGEGDGCSAEVDFASGEPYAPYVDCSLAGIEARVRLIKGLRSRGKTAVANFYCTSREEQSLPINRFAETLWVTTQMDWEVGSKPPPLNYMFFGHLNSPIALGLNNSPTPPNSPERLMQGLVLYLRHGLLYYHHVLREPPRTGPDAVEFGPVNHMFPFTPVELREGWVIGKERIITARSINVVWRKRGRPVPHLFDMRGREIPAADRCEISPAGDGWRVVVRLRDWAEIAVVE